MKYAVGRLYYALYAEREEHGLCPVVKNPAFDAGMVFFQFFPAVTSYAQELETMVKREFNMPRISKRVHANPLNFENQRERFSALSRLTRMMFCTGT